jgi:hypothetical protein
MGFDAFVDFPPQRIAVRDVSGSVEGLRDTFSGLIYDYGHVVDQDLARRAAGYADGRGHRGLMLAWDNTARRGASAHIAHGATPELYRRWLTGIIEQEMAHNPASESLVFVNAWNEWAEGATLEPDTQFGTGFLEATRAALDDLGVVPTTLVGVEGRITPRFRESQAARSGSASVWNRPRRVRPMARPT